MATSRKKPVRRRSPARKTAGKKKPKVQLKNSSVIALSLLLALLCGLLIFMNIIMTGGDKSAEDKKNSPASKVAAEKTFKPSKDSSLKNNSSHSENPASEKSSSRDSADSGSSGNSINSSNSLNSGEKTSSSNKAAQNQSQSQIQIQEKIASASPSQGSKPLPPKFNIPKAAKKAVLVFVIDDAGLSVANTKKYASLPFPVTIAVLPKLAHSKDCAYVVRSSGQELILHQPMQSLNLKLNPGPGAITADMGTYQIATLVKENLDEIGPGVKGMNNHEGSMITSDKIKIGAVLEVCSERGIYFLDSRTTADTQAPQAALERDMTIFEKNAPYIDNVVSREAMLKEIYGCLDVANKKGTAIMIGHVDKSAAILPALLKEMYPYLVEKGYTFATPSTLYKGESCF
ncbi:divergent polysaccharide deacetylase family protein [Treponema sp.]|uniref:divergent polysaccharide deacetylase family protein n=1 Tax=Treponema sp. TaxID=166 RepID=UPI0025D17466|nr:divergent polysaccharide deacetylase family protein [Treponema sp.]MCR5218212.1 divergent polysaccharide deacetylase family protein [Treponema sp.]